MENENQNPTIIQNDTSQIANPTNQGIQAEQLTPEYIEKLRKDIDSLKSEANRSKIDIVTVLGIFASFITFVSVEFQLIKNLTKFSQFLSLSILLVSLMIFFAATLHHFINDVDEKFFKRPIFILASILFTVSILIFAGPYIYNFFL